MQFTRVSSTSLSVRSWSTDAVPLNRRLDYFIGAICEAFLEMDMNVPVSERAKFDAELVSSPLGGVALNRVRCSTSANVHRTRLAISRAEQDFFYLMSGDREWNALQQGRAARLLPGDLVLVDSRRCYQFHFPTPTSVTSLQLPIAWVDSWLPNAEALTAVRIEANTGWGAALSRFAQQLQPELTTDLPLPAKVLEDQLGALLALCGRVQYEPVRESRWSQSRVMQVIRESFGEPGLTGEEVARRVGVSERTLHREMAGHGTTFAQALLEVRMQSAKRMLSDRRFDSLTVGEIGRRNGFSDASHFVRQCRRHLGSTPGVLRRTR